MRATQVPRYHATTISTPPGLGTARHSAYRSQFVVVAYPWHPLHGQRVRVYGRQRRAGRQILYIEVQPGLSREIPAWMCDAAVCATISSGPPRIAVAALTELRAVLAPSGGLKGRSHALWPAPAPSPSPGPAEVKQARLGGAARPLLMRDVAGGNRAERPTPSQVPTQRWVREPAPA